VTSDTLPAGESTADAPGRGRLVAALAAALVGHDAPELRLVRRWLDGWAGLGLVVADMARQDFDLELRGFPRGWRATFYPSGLAHSIVAGTGWASSPWRATQRAAWNALARELPRAT
jgi:hypothetical protein